MKPLRLGVIGAGSWAVAAHLPAFARRPEVEPAIVYRRDSVLAERIRSDFGFARATTDWHEVMDDRPELVVVASPAALHAEQVRPALEAGSHVLCTGWSSLARGRELAHPTRVAHTFA